jgi:hypothetical protein
MPLPKENLGHPCFPQPDDPSVRVWRYIDLPKLMSMMTRRELVLNRVDSLPDKFEGRSGRHFHAVMTAAMMEMPAGVDIKLEDRIRMAEDSARQSLLSEDRTRAVSYVSCWCAGGAHESEAMWRIYGAGAASVALVLPYDRLRDSLNDSRLYIGRVTYFDYDTQVLAFGNVYRPLMFKRHEFSHEKEIRIAKMLHEYWDPGVPLGSGGRPQADRPTILTIPWDLLDYAEQIVISPYAAKWQHETIREVVARLYPGLEGRVVDSKMGGEPHG